MSITALIVDDSATARQIISYHLHHAGCTIIGEAANATIALKLFREHKPAVVTLDLMMPRVLNVDSKIRTRLCRSVQQTVVRQDALGGLAPCRAQLGPS